MFTHFFKEKKSLLIAFTVSPQNTTTNLKFPRRTSSYISEHVVSFCPLFGMDREHTWVWRTNDPENTWWAMTQRKDNEASNAVTKKS